MNGYKKNYHLERKFREFSDMRDLLRESAGKFGARTAFVTKRPNPDDPKKPFYINTTYADMFREIQYLGTALWKLGYGGERFALIGENSYKWVLSYCTTACGLGVLIPLDKLLHERELEGLLQRSRTKVIFCDKKHYATILSLINRGETDVELMVGLDFDPAEEEQRGADRLQAKTAFLDALLVRGKEALQGGCRSFVDAVIDRDALALIVFTSGTTSKSKGVMLSQRNLMTVNYNMNLEEYFTPDDVNLQILPLHHVYGMGGLTTFMSQGMKTAFCDGLKYININLKEYGVSVLLTVPLLLEAIYKRIMKTAEKQGMTKKIHHALRLCAYAEKMGLNIRRRVFSPIIRELGGRMRFIINGAAALDPKVAKGMNDFGILTVQGYGLTETAPTIAAESYRYLRAGSCGRVLQNIEARIVDPDENGIGELVVRGDNVMLGYYDDPESTDAVLVNGWLHTNDFASFDADGYLWIAGRKNNVIVMKNGKNVFPEEIETLINNLPYVTESMVFSMNKSTDVVLWVKVVVDPDFMKEKGMSREDMEGMFDADLDAINKTLPVYKMVKHFLLSDRPTIKNTSQKTKRKEELAQIMEELRERGIKK